MSMQSLLELEDVSRGVDLSTLVNHTSTHTYKQREGVSQEST